VFDASSSSLTMEGSLLTSSITVLKVEQQLYVEPLGKLSLDFFDVNFNVRLFSAWQLLLLEYQFCKFGECISVLV